jgi:hypothetical protein
MSPSPAIFYAAREMETPDVAGRPARSAQSLAARGLAEALAQAAGLAEAPDLAQSRSHCRGFVAAAVGAGSGLRLGVDLEYDAPGRPIAEIAALYLGAPVPDLSPGAFYRAWTVGEAWVKAFGARPEAALVRLVLDREVADGRVYRLGEAAVMHDTPAPGFRLSLVWSHAETYAAPCRLLG